MLTNDQAKNQITATVEFHFKGEKITASVELDLDLVMQTNQELPNLYPLLGFSINLDIYSYEYEMMQAEEVRFGCAKGVARNYLQDNFFDFEAFKSACISNQVNLKLSDIALRHLGIDTLDEQLGLKRALLEAYEFGRCDSFSIPKEY